MKLYLIQQDTNMGYDTFDSAVVAAKSEEDAKTIHPYADADRTGWESNTTWCKTPEQVQATLIGTACKGTARGVVLASFYAG